MRITRFIPAIGWFLFSLFLLCSPGSAFPKYPWLALVHADKLIHIVLFGTLGLLFSFPLHKSSLDRASRTRWFQCILACGIAYGTIMEFVQEYWVVNRSFEGWDIMADGIGCLLAYWYSVHNYSNL